MSKYHKWWKHVRGIYHVLSWPNKMNLVSDVVLYPTLSMALCTSHSYYSDHQGDLVLMHRSGKTTPVVFPSLPNISKSKEKVWCHIHLIWTLLKIILIRFILQRFIQNGVWFLWKKYNEKLKDFLNIHFTLKKKMKW